MVSLFSVQAQDEKLSKKERKKMEKIARIEKTYIKTGELLENKRFVLEADYLDNQRGNRIVVPNSLNFIKVDSIDAVLQIGRNSGIGNNGVGGTTAEGRIAKYQVSKNEKNKSYDVRMNINTNIGNYDVFMNVGSDGSARATISGITPGKLIYDGEIVSIDDSRTFKGRSL